MSIRERVCVATGSGAHYYVSADKAPKEKAKQAKRNNSKRSYEWQKVEWRPMPSAGYIVMQLV